MLIENHQASTGQSKRILEWQPTLFDTFATNLIRQELEELKLSNAKMRKALFARDDFLNKEIEVLSNVVSDLAEAYLELLKRTECKAALHWPSSCEYLTWVYIENEAMEFNFSCRIFIGYRRCNPP